MTANVTRRLTVQGDFTALGTSDETFASEADFLVSGTFVGTVVVEVKENGRDNWAPACTETAPAVRRILVSRGRQFRVRCSAFTSGTIQYSLESKTDYLSER